MTRVIFLDFEASSLGIRGHPTAVGLAVADRVTARVRTRSWLIAPHPEWQFADGSEWNAGAARITGLSRERCEREGRAPATVARALNATLAGSTAHISAISDKHWCEILFDAGDPPVVRRFALRHIGRIPVAHGGEDDSIHRQAWADAVSAVDQDRLWTRHDPAHDAGRLADAYLRYLGLIAEPT